MLPKAQTIPPGTFFSLYPTKIEMFTAKMPGKDWATEKRSMKSSFESHPLSTTSRCIRGSIAYPPPIVKVPILTNVRKSVQYIIL